MRHHTLLIAILGFFSLLYAPLQAQKPVESPVRFALSYAPRSPAGVSKKAVSVSHGSLIAQMGFSGGAISCVGDALDRTAPWKFKHRVYSQTEAATPVETDLSEKIKIEVLGYSETGVVKEPLTVAPSQPLRLGRVVSTRTVKITLESDSGYPSEFWGSLARTPK